MFITWPNAENPAYAKPSSFSRKEFGRAIEGARRNLNAAVESMAIFREARKDANPHYHALAILATKSYRLWELDEQLFKEHKAKTFTEIVVGGAKKPHFRVLEYLMCPNPRKTEVDEAPYITKKMVIPDKLWDKAAKAKSRLENAPATLDEIFAFRQENPKVDSYESLLDLLEAGPDAKNRVNKVRISKYVNNNIGRAQELINGLISRRGRAHFQEENLKTPMRYLEANAQYCVKCVCPTGPGLTTLAEDIDFLINFHTPRNVSPFFDWADKFFSGKLPTPGRPRNCYIIGCPGSGKSTLADLVAYVIPPNRTFSPTLDSSTPFSGLRDHYLLATCDDWRFTPKVPVTGTLQWLEGRKFGVDVKGKEAIAIQSGPPCLFSSNHNSSTANWRDVDIEAFRGRCFVVTMKNPVPPVNRTNVSEKMKTCAFCRIASLAKHSPSVCDILRRVKSAPPPYTQEASEVYRGTVGTLKPKRPRPFGAATADVPSGKHGSSVEADFSSGTNTPKCPRASSVASFEDPFSADDFFGEADFFREEDGF